MADDAAVGGLDNSEVTRLRASYIRNDVRIMTERRGALTECCACGVSAATAVTMSQGVDDQASALVRGALARIAAEPQASAGQRRFARGYAERATAVSREDWLPERPAYSPVPGCQARTLLTASR